MFYPQIKGNVNFSAGNLRWGNGSFDSLSLAQDDRLSFFTHPVREDLDPLKRLLLEEKLSATAD